MVFPFSHYIFCCLVYPTFSYSYLVIASTPALAVAEGTTNPDPCSAYVAVIAKKLAPIIQKYNLLYLTACDMGTKCTDTTTHGL